MAGAADQAASTSNPVEAAQSADSQPKSHTTTSPDLGHAAEFSASPSGSQAPSDGTSCANCNKCPPSSDTDALKPCMMCHSVSYCSRECKKAHTKHHKKVCAAAAQEYAKTADVKLAVRAAPKQTSRSGGYQKWQFDT